MKLVVPEPESAARVENAHLSVQSAAAFVRSESVFAGARRAVR